jgi:hypothetical protein
VLPRHPTFNQEKRRKDTEGCVTKKVYPPVSSPSLSRSSLSSLHRHHRIGICFIITTMSSEQVQAEVPPNTAQQDNTTPPSHPHRNITFTFPIVFINHAPHPPPSASGNDNSDSIPSQPQHLPIPPEDLPHLVAHLFRSMPLSSLVNGQFEPVPTAPPKKHATQSAIDTLKPVDITTLPQQDRRCHICMQDYYVKPVGPRSPYVEDVKDEEDLLRDVSFLFETKLTMGQGEQDEEDDVLPDLVDTSVEEAEFPVEMPCGHVFGSTCLKAWLYESPTCPLCRVEVESYTEEAQPNAPSTGFPPFPWAQQPTSTSTPSQQPSDEMQVDPQSTQTTPTPNTDTPPQPTVPQFGQLEFQFIFTAPSPSTPSPPTPTPSTTRSTTPRPTSSHSVRHHPYARAVTPSPLSGPSIIDRPDLSCAQRLSGLCPHDHTPDENLLRLECGHAFHTDCLEGSMLVEGYPINEGERRCPRCRRWMSILQ